MTTDSGREYPIAVRIDPWFKPVLYFSVVAVGLLAFTAGAAFGTLKISAILFVQLGLLAAVWTVFDRSIRKFERTNLDDERREVSAHEQ